MTFMGPLKRLTAQVGLENGLGLESTSATQAVHCRFRPSHGLYICAIVFSLITGKKNPITEEKDIKVQPGIKLA